MIERSKSLSIIQLLVFAALLTFPVAMVMVQFTYLGAPGPMQMGLEILGFSILSLVGAGAYFRMHGGGERAQFELIRLRKAVESSGEVIFLTDIDGTFRWINPAFKKIYGFTSEETIGKSTPRILKSGFMKQEHYIEFWKRISDGEAVNAELVNKTKDGRLVTVESSANPVLDERGRIVAYLAIQKDVTDRKTTEAALRESEELYRTLVDISPDAIVLTTLSGTIQLCSQQMATMYGFASTADLIGVDAISLISEEERHDARTRILPILRTRRIITHEHIFIRKDGSRFQGELNVNAYLNSQGQPRGFVGIVRDLSIRRQLESQLIQAQKMEAIGNMAGGIAHDFNNLLTAILGYGDLLLCDPTITPTQRQDIQSIKRVSEKAGNLVRQLLAFSRKQVLLPVVLNLNTVVTDMSKMLHRLIGRNIELSNLLAQDLGSVRADPVQIEQVLLNLAVNSRDAMPQGGKLIIQTENVEIFDTSRLQPKGVSAGAYVMLMVRDTGLGMNAEVLSHVFEPFFSTKETGRGTGLGLSTVYGIVSQSGGAIAIESSPESGTCFRIYLPRVQAENKASGAPDVLRSMVEGSETILVVEDEEGVRNVVCASLQSKGYRVLEARNGFEAMEICTNYAQPIHVLVTDLVMPRMGGIELVTLLTQSGRKLKVVYVSGYSDHASSIQEALKKGAVFIQKPFSMDQLTRQIRILCENPPSTSK